MDFLSLAKKRYACRKYTAQKVEQAKLDTILEAVRAEFNLPEHVEPVNILLVGYGAGIPADPGRHELLRKPLSETVVEERF